MSSCYGENLRLSIFGQSHSPAIGVTIDGLPAGYPLDTDALNRFLQRRAPGRTNLSTPRREEDAFEILSGMADGRLCGAPFAAIIRNTNVRSKDYSTLRDTPRPGHADYTASVKYSGFQDVNGGGHFSGRLTAPLCLAGGICLQLLAEEGVRIGAHALRIGGVQDTAFDAAHVSETDLDAIAGDIPVLDAQAGEAMAAAIEAARAQGDSVGGVVECAACGLPVGLGDPMFDGMENRIAQAAFAIPAVKGIEFGAGFGCAGMTGSTANDPFRMENGRVVTQTNNHGGILGGITSGMPLIFRVAVKPTPSIFQRQNTVRLSAMENAELSLKGRHDPCIVPRAVPCVEAAAAIAIYDAYLSWKKLH